MKQLVKKTIFMFAAILICGIWISGCAKESSIRYEFNTQPGSTRYPDANFAVISDLHIYTAELGSSGSAFERVMMADRKLLLNSIELMEFAMNEIIASGVSFILISGDLTKDGELINHRILAEKLGRLKDAGIAAYVVPGNHDVNNPESFRFIGDRTELVPTVSAVEFAEIYADFGYGNAVMRDSDSLSYVAEVAEGLWLLAIDTCRWKENVEGDHPHVDGRISQETANWIANVGREALRQNKAVMAMMHHGFIEHWNGQAKLHPKYIINDFANFTRFLASWNIRFGFSGHYHAQDITRADFNGSEFYDIQTGSLVTAPSPIRYVQIRNNALDIRSDFIIDRIHPGTDFAANAHAFVKRTVMLEAASVLRRYWVSQKDIAIIVDAVGDAFVAHYSGDEDPTQRPYLDRSKLGLWGRFILSQQQYALDGLWRDLPPADNNVTIYFF